MGEWKACLLGAMIELKRGYDLPKSKRKAGIIPIISSSGFSDTHIEAKVNGPGVITGRYGTIGTVYYVEEPYWPLNTTLYVRDFKGNDPRFVSYFLRGIDFMAYSDKAAVPGVNRNHLHQAQVLLPPLPEQRAIAAVLSALDDKIELNRRMNRTLERQARALFADWFVHFGPTRAKQEARRAAGATANAKTAPPYLPPELWSLFPDRLNDEGIPEGWEMGTLADIAQSPRRGVKPAEVSEDTPYIGLEHMPRRSIALSDWDGAGKVSSNKSRFIKGEFLFGKLRPYFHKVGVAAISGICSTDIVVVKPKAEDWAALTLACISSDAFVDYTNASSTGTKMPRTSWKIMGAYELCIPPREVAQAFQATVGPMIEKIIDNIHQSRTLAQTRDLLLPRLMSGALRVAEAEAIVEGVG